jgi:hypothetical protein
MTTKPTAEDRDAQAFAVWVADMLAEAARGLERGPMRVRVERHTLPGGKRLAGFEVRSRRYGTRAVIHVEPGL